MEIIDKLKKAKSTIEKIENKQIELESNERKIEETRNAAIKRFTMPKGYSRLLGLFIGGLLVCAGELIANSNTLLGIVCILGIVGFIVLYFHIKNKKIEKLKVWLKEAAEPLVEKQIGILGEAEKIINSDDYRFLCELIPEDYFDSESVGYFIKVISNKRADNLKEAMNLYEDYLHKQRLEDLQQQQVQLAQMSLSEQQNLRKQNEVNTELMIKQAAAMERIRKNTNATKNAARINAFLTLVKK